MSIERIKKYTEGVSFPALNLQQITDTIIRELQTFFRNIHIRMNIINNNYIIAADNKIFVLNINYNWQMKEFKIEKMEVLN